MDSGPISLGLMVILGLLMIAAAISDVRSRTISNELNAAMALLAIPFWIASGLALWLFAIGAMGGGDVKMIGAVMLWIPLPLFLPMLMIMAIGGGILSAVMLIHMKLRPSDKAVEVPYGVAIAAAGLWALHQHYLNPFQVIG